jgi:hypothetical protein
MSSSVTPTITDTLIEEYFQNRVTTLTGSLKELQDQRADFIRKWTALREKSRKLGFKWHDAPYVPANADRETARQIKTCEDVLAALKHPYAINFDETPAYMYRVTKVTPKRIYFIHLHYGYYYGNRDLANLRADDEVFISQEMTLPPFSPSLTVQQMQSNLTTK